VSPSLALRLEHVPTPHQARPYLEVEPKTPSSSSPTTFHVQWQPRTSHRQAPRHGSYKNITTPTLLHQSCVPRTQSVRRGEGRHRPVFTQQTHKLKDLQNVRYLQNTQRNTKTSPLHINRLIRRLLPHPSSPSLPEIPLVHVPKQTFHVSNNAFRDKVRSPHIHQGYHRGPQISSQATNSSIRIHRRLAALERLSGPPEGEHCRSDKAPNHFRFFNQLGKIAITAFPVHNLSRSHVERPGLYHRPKPQEHRESAANRVRPNSQQSHDQESVPAIPGGHQLPSPFHPSGPLPSPSSYHGSSEVPLPQEPNTNHQLAYGSPVVDTADKPAQATPNLLAPSPAHHMDRRFLFRVGGSLLPRKLRVGSMAETGPGPAHQPARGESSAPLHQSVLPEHGIVHPDQIRQHGSGVLAEQARVQSYPSSQRHPAASPSAVRQPQLDGAGSTHPGSSQHLGGLPLPESRHPVRMVHDPELLQPNPSGSSDGHRPLCTPGQRKAADLRLPLSPSSSPDHGRTVGRLEPMEQDLPVPSNGPPTHLPPKNGNLRRWWRHRRTLPTNSTLVARAYDPVRAIRHRARNLPAGPRRATVGTKRDVATLSRVQFLTKIFERKFPPAVTQSLITSTRVSTNTQYQTCWKHF